MDELREHLATGNLGSLYINKSTGLTEYNHLFAFTYAIIKRALDEGADQLEVRKSSLRWSRQGQILREWNYHFPRDPVNFAVLMRKIVKTDSVVREHTKADDDHYSHITIEFL